MDLLRTTGPNVSPCGSYISVLLHKILFILPQFSHFHSSPLEKHLLTVIEFIIDWKGENQVPWSSQCLSASGFYLFYFSTSLSHKYTHSCSFTGCYTPLNANLFLLSTLFCKSFLCFVFILLVCFLVLILARPMFGRNCFSMLLPFCHSVSSLLLCGTVPCIFHNFLRWHWKGSQVTGVHLRLNPVYILMQVNNTDRHHWSSSMTGLFISLK